MAALSLDSALLLLLRPRALACSTKNEVCFNHLSTFEPICEFIIHLRLQVVLYSISKLVSSSDCLVNEGGTSITASKTSEPETGIKRT